MNNVDLQFNDWKEIIENSLGKTEWITVYKSIQTHCEEEFLYCALIAEKTIKRSLEHTSWDLTIGNGFPGFTFHYKNEEEFAEYYRYSFPDNDIEPLIFSRSFNGNKKGYKEIAEEFRYYFNLYEDRINNKFISIDDDGDEEDVILIEDGKIQIKLKYLKEFLAVKKMYLALFFDIKRYSEKTLEELQIKEYNNEVKNDNYIYSKDYGVALKNNIKIWGRLCGKKMIPGLINFKPQLFKGKNFEEFIIDIDEDGKEILYICDPEKLANYFGKNPEAPNFMTPVFFRKEVLSEYYSNSEKYTVEDGILYCDGLWSLFIDNDHKDYVIVFLGYLGQSLSLKEQKRWKRFNITPQGKKISETAYRRAFKGEFSDPEKSDLYFKQKYELFQTKWVKKFTWKLFNPLNKADEHHFKSLRIPLTNNQKEFDEQVGSLVKIIIDSLNEKEIEKGVEITKAGLKGIDKLEAFLIKHNMDFTQVSGFLRDLQDLRSSGTAHLKGEKYKKIAKKFLIGEKSFQDIFDDILIQSIHILDILEIHFLK